MKIRIGFVSNSSSSSYVVLMPEDFEKQLPSGEREEIIALAEKLATDGQLWQEEEDGGDYEELLQKVDRYIVATVDSGPDDGKIILCDPRKVRKIINEG